MCRLFQSAGNLLDPTKWEAGLLPGPGFTCHIGRRHVDRRPSVPPSGAVFELKCNEGGGGSLTVTGAATINATTVTAAEYLDDSAATNLVINGNVETSATFGYTYQGATTINGALTAGGPASPGYAVSVAVTGELTVTYGITALSGESEGIYNEGSLIASCYGEAGSDGFFGHAGIWNNGGTIIGNCQGYGGDTVVGDGGVGIYNYASGEITGECEGYGGDSGATGGNGIDVASGTITGTCIGLGGAAFSGGTGIAITGEIVGDCTGTGGAGSDYGGIGMYVAGTMTGSCSGTGGAGATTGGTGVHNIGTINLIGAFVAIKVSGGTEQALYNANSITSIVPAAAGDVRLGTPRYTPDGPAGTLDIAADNPHDIIRLVS